MIIVLLLFIMSPILLPLGYGLMQLLKHLLIGIAQMGVQMGMIVIALCVLAYSGALIARYSEYIGLALKGLFFVALIGAIVTFLVTANRDVKMKGD